MGYGARALESLNSFYSGDLLNLDEVMEEDTAETFAEAATKIDKVSLLLGDIQSPSCTDEIITVFRIPPCKTTTLASATSTKCLLSFSVCLRDDRNSLITSECRTV